jgi:hypothetical protein
VRPALIVKISRPANDAIDSTALTVAQPDTWALIQCPNHLASFRFHPAQTAPQAHFHRTPSPQTHQPQLIYWCTKLRKMNRS